MVPDLPLLESTSPIHMIPVTTVEADILSEKINSIFAREIERIVERIAWVDARLAQLGDDEEDQIERILLEALRRHLLNDLRELGGFSGDPFLFEPPEAELGTPATLAGEDAVSYS